MQNGDYTSSSDFLKRLFGETLHKIELRACSNERSGSASSVFTRDDAEIEAFCMRRDQPGWGTYFGVCTRRDGVSGTAADVLECPALWVDIDCAAQGISGEEALRALQWLPYPPTLIVNSGGGLHAYWVLEEAVDVSEGSPARDAVVEALRRLVAILAGDSKCAELARIMRLPGTHNSKPKTLALYDGQPAVCELVDDTQVVHDFEALCEWLGEQRVVLHGAVEPIKAVQESDPFVAYARAAGYEPAIDIDQALAAMRHEAAGDTSIHATQLRVSASMIGRGYEDDEIVARILAATEAAAPRDARWNWRREEQSIRAMIRTGRAKGYDKPRERPSTQPMVAGNTALKLVHNADTEPKANKPVKESKSTTVAVGKATIGVWQDRYGPVMHTDGTTYVYEDGIWNIWDDRMAQRLRAIIQEACASLRVEPKTSLLNAARAYFMDRPELVRDNVDFDTHGLLIADDAALDLATMQVVPHSPDHYGLFKVAAKLAGSRDCHAWLDFLRGAFSDRTCADEIIATVQEWYGASIAVTRSRPLLKGMLAHGGSRTGKTQVSKVARAIIGERHICNARMRDLEGRFGMEPLIGRRGWIADDAIGPKEYLDAEAYKVIVTGETTSAQMKGGKNWEGRFGFPVMLTANTLPRVNDKSDATYNRSLILPMTVVRPEDAPEPAGYDSIADKIIAEELTGVLWWAIEGRQRLFARGRFNPPLAMTDAGRSFQDANDPIGSWMRQCLEPDRMVKIARKDLAASFNGWWALESDDGKPFSANSITRTIAERYPTLADLKSNGERMFGGVRLNEEGLFAWKSLVDSGGVDRKPAFSLTREEVNRFWDGAASISSAPAESAPKKEKDLAITKF